MPSIDSGPWKRSKPRTKTSCSLRLPPELEATTPGANASALSRVFLEKAHIASPVMTVPPMRSSCPRVKTFAGSPVALPVPSAVEAVAPLPEFCCAPFFVGRFGW